MVQPILTFSKILTKREYGSTDLASLKNFDKKIMLFNPSCVFREFLPKDNTPHLIQSFKKVLTKENMVQHWLSFQSILTKRQQVLTHIVFQETFDLNILWFNRRCLFQKIVTKRQYGSTHTDFFQNFNQKRIWLNPRCLFRIFCPKGNTVYYKLEIF